MKLTLFNPLFAAGLLSVPVVVVAQEAADLVVQHASVWTVDDRQPRAESFAVKDGRFVSVGTDEAVKSSIGEGTTVLDLRGKTVVPGFIDAHCHPGPVYPEESRWAPVDCRPAKVRTIDDLVAALARKAAATPAGEWVLGSRYQDLKLGRPPTRVDLDRASTKHPIIISHASGHQSVCNSLALRLAKVTAKTRDPAGGEFGRDARGEPNGLLQEGAAGVVRAAIADRPDPPQAEMMTAYREGFRRYLSRGITSVGVAGGTPGFGRLLERVRTEELPLRLNMILGQSAIDEAAKRKTEGKLGDAGVRYGGIKIFHGGSVSAHTCWISQPYAGRADYFGLVPGRSQETLNDLILRVHRAGLQACVHSNGDREIEMVLNAFAYALKEAPRSDHRHRLEHCSVVTEALLRRIKELGVIVVPHSYLWELGDTIEAFGKAQWDWIHPARSLLDLGIPMAAHSDSPVATADPLQRIQAMVTRTSAEGKVYGATQRVTVEEALRAWTLGGAFAAFEEQSKGSVAVGKLADFVVLAADLAAVDATAIQDIAVEKTFVGGRMVFPASGAPRPLEPKAPADDLTGPPFVTAKAWAIADGKTGETLWNAAGDQPLKSASTTKMMCALVVLELAAKDPAVLEETVTFSPLADGTAGSTAAIKAGESLSVRECLYGLLLPSGNDAGNALAEHFNARCAEPDATIAADLSSSRLTTRARFIALMNRHAQRLGMTKTVYRIPYGDGGTPQDFTTTARDLARLGATALRNAAFRQIVATRQHTAKVRGTSGETRAATWDNTNDLLGIEGYDGIKTGTTTTAGACLVSSGHRGKDHLIVVILGADSDRGRFVETRNLFRWAWNQRTPQTSQPPP